MTAPFRCDETVTIEQDVGVTQDAYSKRVEDWQVVLDHGWCNVQDLLPSRAEATNNGIRVGVQRTRLRIPINNAIEATMRAVLHGRGDRVMQIIAGPAQLDDLRHIEFMLESYSS